MSTPSAENLRIAIDVGTTKVCVLIAHTSRDAFDIIGIGTAPSHGLERGVVVDMADAASTIKHAVQQAEMMAGYSVEWADVGISGAHISAHSSSGMVPVKGRTIDGRDVQRVIANAQTIPLDEGEHILHVIPQEYTIDREHVVDEPVGLHGVRLEAKVHIITGGVSSVQNLIHCCQAAGIKVRDIILEPLGSAYAVLSKDEREFGTALLDIGGGTADLAIYYKDHIRHTRVFPIGGTLFTKDLAICLSIGKTEAERVKVAYSSDRNNVDPHYTYSLSAIDGEQERSVAHHHVGAILNARTQELLDMVANEITTYSLGHYMTTGCVITGGGSLLGGLIPCGHKTLNVPVRSGMPKVPPTCATTLRHPSYATAYGLLTYSLHQEHKRQETERRGPLLHRIWSRMKSWIVETRY